MSPTKARGKGGPPKYLPVGLEENFRPSEEDMKYAERFQRTAGVIEECRNAELVALLLSTCRNQWMAVNGMFVDLQGILGADHLPDLASRGYYDFAEGKMDRSAKLFNKALQLRAALAQKLACWSKREALLEQLKKAIASPKRDALERDRLEGWLARQGHGLSIPGRIRQAQYLRLDLADTHCAEELALIERSTAKLTAALRIAHRTARLAALGESIAAGKAEQAEETDPLFDLSEDVDAEPGEELDRQAESERKLAGAWAKLRDVVLSHGAEIGFDVSGGEGDPIEIEGPDGECFRIEVEITEAALAEEPPAALGGLMSRSRTIVDATRSKVFEAFTPNVAVPPMPSPFVVDLTPDDSASSEGRVRPFIIRTADGRQRTLDTAKLALLRCGMPASAYSTARKEHITYHPDHKEGARQAREIALAAVAEAQNREAAFLVMPEVFLPRGAVREVRRAAEEAKIGLIAGVEYPEKQGGPINEVLVDIPGWDEPLRQRKQAPSVEELNHTSFESTLELFLIRRTALGNIGVIVCSDVMELDLVWALASFDYVLDVVVVCARNYKPEIFERLAIADASRLHALIAVVNSWAPRAKDKELPSGKGTLVARPDSEEPLLPLAEYPLEVSWDGAIEQPSIAIAELNIAEIRARDLERPGAHGYITPPHFVRT